MTIDLFMGSLVGGFLMMIGFLVLGSLISYLIQKAVAFINDSETCVNWFFDKITDIMDKDWKKLLFFLFPFILTMILNFKTIALIVISVIGLSVALLFLARGLRRLIKRVGEHTSDRSIHR